MNDRETTGRPRQALIVMGVSGSGKTTVAGLLGERLGWPVAEADEFHSAANVAKMSAGIPLDDDDRWPWLAAIRDWISSAPADVIVTCSALRRRYRDRLREADALVRFVHLDGERAEIAPRMAARTGHFMPAGLLDSQLETLEPLAADEDGVVIDVSAPPARLVEQAVMRLGLD